MDRDSQILQQTSEHIHALNERLQAAEAALALCRRLQAHSAAYLQSRIFDLQDRVERLEQARGAT